jgi:hypothetical protein
MKQEPNQIPYFTYLPQPVELIQGYQTIIKMPVVRDADGDPFYVDVVLT